MAIRWSWNAQLNLSLRERIVRWQHVIRGWWNDFGIAQDQKPIQALEGWMRRHRRKYFWQRGHNRTGRLNALRTLGVKLRTCFKTLLEPVFYASKNSRRYLQMPENQYARARLDYHQ